jgi:hypothetical protein
MEKEIIIDIIKNDKEFKKQYTLNLEENIKENLEEVMYNYRIYLNKNIIPKVEIANYDNECKREVYMINDDKYKNYMILVEKFADSVVFDKTDNYSLIEMNEVLRNIEEEIRIKTKFLNEMKNAVPKTSSGSYERIFDNKALGDLITKIQSTSISNGSELERIIIEKCTQQNYIIDNFDTFLNEFNNKKAENIIKIVPKKVIKKSKILENDVNFEPDFIILKIDAKNKICYIIELKDGYEFDTKKVIGEKEHLEKFADFIARKIPYTIEIKFCCFNELNKNKIKIGLKGAFELNEIINGLEFCNLLNIDYYEILEYRLKDAKVNLEYFVEELLLIDEVKKLLENKLNLTIYN